VRQRIAVIIGSTRMGRVGDAIARWFVDRAKQRDDLELDVLDLAEFDFPARYPEEVTAEMNRFTGSIDRADGFVVVTPEYNRSFPASLKQAIDYGYDEWHAKPVGFVSYGCRSRGHYAVEGLRVVFTELHTVCVRDEVSIDLMDVTLRPDGSPRHVDGLEPTVTVMLDQLLWWSNALRTARATNPYVA
jgi:NAD(P)H-dependent FMN reductase